MSYETYKLIHLFSLIAIVVCLTTNGLSPAPKKWAKITGMVASLLLMVAGMGLLARTGHSHGAGWPIWVKIKIGIWLVLAVGGPIAYKRLPSKRPLILGMALALLAAAISLVVFR
ncbi:MAG: hypothetical protein HN509_15525 [Halobacteriovoraceae bacterium]|jgi:uncharacterized membrane protein SirB2|nr:hypothetical protein [Halobacteriovoraceae bacterium]